MLLSVGLKSTEKKLPIFLILFFFFILLIAKSFDILPKHSAKSFISEFFALNCYTFAALTNKKLLLPLWCRLNANLFPDCIKLIEYFASSVNVVSSNPYVSLSPRLNMFFPLLSACTDESYQLQKWYRQMMKLLNENQVLRRSRCTCIYLDQYS